MKESRLSVLVVEDEKAYADALDIGLAREGFTVRTASTAREALALFDRMRPGIVLLDLMLPGGSGMDVCREIRKRGQTPVIMLTAKDDETDKVLGLEFGADDYLTKPYSLRELVARMRAVLRRSEAAANGEGRAEMLEVGPVELDLARHAVRVRGQEVNLPLREFELLQMLMEHAGRAVTRGSLMDQVWGFDFVGESKTLDVHVQRLRGRIERDPGTPRLISTIRGVGYRFEREAREDDAEAAQAEDPAPEPPLSDQDSSA